MRETEIVEQAVSGLGTSLVPRLEARYLGVGLPVLCDFSRPYREPVGQVLLTDNASRAIGVYMSVPYVRAVEPILLRAATRTALPSNGRY